MGERLCAIVSFCARTPETEVENTLKHSISLCDASKNLFINTLYVALA